MKYLIKQMEDITSDTINIEFQCSVNFLPKNLPSGIIGITFSNFFNCLVDMLPPKLEILKFGKMFNKSVNNLPLGLKVLKFGYNFNLRVDYLPEILEYLEFGKCFNQPLNNLPTNLIYLIIGDSYSVYNQPLNNLPTWLKILCVEGWDFNQHLMYLPQKLRKLSISNPNYPHNNKEFFSKLANLNVEYEYNIPHTCCRGYLGPIDGELGPSCGSNNSRTIGICYTDKKNKCKNNYKNSCENKYMDEIITFEWA